MNGSIKFTINCLKYDSIASDIKDYCFMRDLKCNVETEKGLIGATHRIQVFGSEYELKRLEKFLDGIVSERG